MADNDTDLVSQIKITGGTESASEIEKFADKGAAAFDKLAGAAAKADASVSKSTKDIEAKGKQAAAGLENSLGRVNVSDFTRSVGNVKDKLDDLTRTFPPLIQAAGRFAQRLVIVGAGAVAAGIGLARVATNVVKAVDGQNTALDDLTKSQIDANNAALDGRIAQINYESSIRQLNQQLATGKISYLDYAAAVKKLNEDFREQRRVAAEVASAQQAVKEENDRLTKSLADRKAYNDLIDTFGGPLVTAFSALGRVVGGIKNSIVSAFGPAAAKLIDLITSVLTRNAGAISSFFDVASKKLDDLITKHGPELQKAMETLGGAVASVFLGILDALPGLIDFFNNKLAPAIGKIAGVVQTLADGFNAVFGTKLTAGSLVLITLFAQMTGSIRILFALLRSGSAVWKGFISLLGAGGEAIAAVFGLKTTGQVVKFGTAITKAGGPISTLFAILKNGIPLIITFARIVGTVLGVGLGVSLPLVIALGAALVYLATQVDWKAFGAAALQALSGLWAWLTQTWENAKTTVNAIKLAWGILVTVFNNVTTAIGNFFAAALDKIVSAWNAAGKFITDSWTAIVDFFSTILTNIGQFFVDLWNGITGGVSTAIAAVQAAWTAVVAWFQTTIITPIQTFFANLWLVITTAVGVAVQAVKDAWGTVVQFFTDIGTNIQAVWQLVADTIVGYWQSAKDKVVSFFSDLYNQAKTYLQPIIDMMTKIASLVAGDSTSGSGGAEGRAAGGPITGPGTGTSDSIPIWASNGEFMVKARAVAKYGMGFMHSINSGNFRMPGFADGGLIGALSPAASYGIGQGGTDGPAMSPLNLTLFGEDFRGLMMPQDVGRRLTKFAIAKQNSSGGRKPGWVGGGKN
jgi:phage-related protein